MKMLQLDDLETKIEPSPPADPMPKTPLWKKLCLIGIVLAIYGGLVAAVFLGSGAVKLIAIVAIIVYVVVSGPVIKGLKKLFKFVELPD